LSDPLRRATGPHEMSSNPSPIPHGVPDSGRAGKA